jgi:hypothetical protein
MSSEYLEKIVKMAKEDPKFFHALVFDTENTLKKVDFLDRQSKASLVAVSPDQVLGAMIGELEFCGVTCTAPSCGTTCTGGSCGVTATGIERVQGEVQFCGVTCTAPSCGTTCTGGSCGVTATGLQDFGRFQR